MKFLLTLILTLSCFSIFGQQNPCKDGYILTSPGYCKKDTRRVCRDGYYFNGDDEKCKIAEIRGEEAKMVYEGWNVTEEYTQYADASEVASWKYRYSDDINAGHGE